MTDEEARGRAPGAGRSRATHRRAVEAIGDRLREEILDGRLVAGSPLREEHLAERFDASRHTVRSALAVLAGERLLTTAPYRGVRVALLGDDEVVELQQLRAAIESEAVRIVVERGVGFGSMRSAVEALGELASSAAPWIEIERAHAAVHQALVDSAGSSRLSASYRALEGELALLLLHTRPAFDGRDLAHEHLLFLEELPSRGVDAVHEHLAASTRDLLATRRAARAVRSRSGIEPRSAQGGNQQQGGRDRE